MHQPEKKSPTAYHDWSSRGASTIVSNYKFSTPSILDPVDNLIDSETLNAVRDRRRLEYSNLFDKHQPVQTQKYDTCFLKWYSEKYLRGKTSSNECEELFSKYKSCLHKALKEKGIDTMVEEARKSTASESDADYLRKT
ncbi:hypothetical protein KXX58_004638 [Aspergillus fumigatus]|nr:hypothetical protein KXX38_008551 [Aspergillus fumigatus]KAH1450741.1 hypothetical protein KXX58_004638 [Aspergillus fumigatus]